VKLRERPVKDDAIAFDIVIGDDDVVGFVGVHHIDKKNQCAQIAYELDIEHRGKGLMTEAMRELIAKAFGEMKLHRLEAHVDPKNAPSLKLVERLGFVHEGYLRENVLEADGFHDTVLLALLAPS
jgi:ribosomal-protein-alanine N-acetyltransferase